MRLEEERMINTEEAGEAQARSVGRQDAEIEEWSFAALRMIGWGVVGTEDTND